MEACFASGVSYGEPEAARHPYYGVDCGKHRHNPREATLADVR
jgi:hypothetical protein